MAASSPEPASPPTPAPADSSFRDHAANERTLLAWIRTGIALMGFGFAIARFGLFLREMAQVGQLHTTRPTGSAWVGVLLVVMGLVTNAASTVRYAQVRTALLERRPAGPSPALAYMLGGGSVAIAGAMAILLFRYLAE